MADPQAAMLTQLRNIQAKTGKTLAQLHAAIAASGLDKHGQRRSWAMEAFGLGHGDANSLVHSIGQPHTGLEDAVAPAASTPAGDALDNIYSGAKAGLRPLHDGVIALIDTFGSYDKAPKKSYVSLRRKKQFAMLGPATKEQLEIGINAKDLLPHTRLKSMPPGGMCQFTVRISQADEVDARLRGWLKAAFDAAG